MRYLNDQKSESTSLDAINTKHGSLTLTSGVIHVHEDHVLIGCEDGVKLLMVDCRKLSNVPVIPAVYRDMDHTLCTLTHKNTCDRPDLRCTSKFYPMQCLRRSKAAWEVLN